MSENEKLLRDVAGLRDTLELVLKQAKMFAERRHIYEQDEFQWAVNRLNKHRSEYDGD